MATHRLREASPQGSKILPELVELDLNPVVVLEHGAIAVDARLRLAAGTSS